MKSYGPRLVALARTFPTLTDAPIDPWGDESADRLDDWAGVQSSGGQHAVRFILSVYNSNHGLPAARVRRWLLEDQYFTSTVEKCFRSAPYDEGTDEQRQTAYNATEHGERARGLYIIGQREKALEEALAAAAAHPGWSPLARLLARPTEVSVEQVLRELHQAEVWNVGPFSLHDAFGVWDDQHRAAFVAWAKNPWWA